jgi:putative flippase GtrA
VSQREKRVRIAIGRLLLKLLDRDFQAEIVRFGIVGVSSVGFYLLVLYLVTEAAGLALLPASIIAYLIAIVWGYTFQRIWTFRSSRSHLVAAPLFVLVQGVGIVINTVMLHVLVERVGLDFAPAQLISVACIAVWTYSAQKFWVFFDASHRSGS